MSAVPGEEAATGPRGQSKAGTRGRRPRPRGLWSPDAQHAPAGTPRGLLGDGGQRRGRPPSASPDVLDPRDGRLSRTSSRTKPALRVRRGPVTESRRPPSSRPGCSPCGGRWPGTLGPAGGGAGGGGSSLGPALPGCLLWVSFHCHLTSVYNILSGHTRTRKETESSDSHCGGSGRSPRLHLFLPGVRVPRLCLHSCVHTQPAVKGQRPGCRASAGLADPVRSRREGGERGPWSVGSVCGCAVCLSCVWSPCGVCVWGLCVVCVYMCAVSVRCVHPRVVSVHRVHPRAVSVCCACTCTCLPCSAYGQETQRGGLSSGSRGAESASPPGRVPSSAASVRAPGALQPEAAAPC